MAISRVNHRLWKLPVLYRNCSKPGFWLQITVISRVNHGYNTGKSWVWGWKQSPPEFSCYSIISGGVYQKKHEKRLLQTAPMLVKSNEQSLNVKFLFTSAKNWVNLGFCPKTVFSGVKPGFTFHCPSKPRFIHKPEKFPGFGGIGCMYIYIYIYIQYIYIYTYA